MSEPLILPYRGVIPAIGADFEAAPGSAVIGRARLGRDVQLGPLATLRADGHDVSVGDGCRFADRATVHIADGVLGASVANRVAAGRFTLIHASTVSDDCVIGDLAVIMDGSVLGPGGVLAAGALVPPGKQLEGGWLYAGSPARPVRQIDEAERAAMWRAVAEGGHHPDVTAAPEDLPALDNAPYLPAGGGNGPLYTLDGRDPAIDRAAYVAPNAVVAGRASVGAESSIWFSTVLFGAGDGIDIGPRTSIQDNSILDSSQGRCTVGSDVTGGHNIRLGACRVGNECLIGMGSIVMDGAVVEDGAFVGARAVVTPGTVVKSGWIWAGNPAKAFREVKPEERTYFLRGKEVYVAYSHRYREAA